MQAAFPCVAQMTNISPRSGRKVDVVIPPDPRPWVGPEPHDLHKLLLTACCGPTTAAHPAWQRWLTECRFDEEDLGSYELAGLAVARLGSQAGTGSIVARCRGWNRRSWWLTTMAVDVATQLRDYSRQQGIELIAVGDILTLESGLRFAGKAFPVRSIEFHVRNGHQRDVEALRAIAQQGTAAAAIQSGRLPLSLRADLRYPRLTHPAGRIVWLISRNWRCSPSGRVRWMLELMAEVATTDDVFGLGVEVADTAQRFGTLAAIQEALNWMCKAQVADDRLRDIHLTVATRWPSLASHARLWRARHPWTPRALRRR
jgi:hypothetical protein